MDNRNFIAKRAAAYFRPGDVVNLGIGIPSLCGSYAVDGVLFQSKARERIHRGILIHDY